MKSRLTSVLLLLTLIFSSAPTADLFVQHAAAASTCDWAQFVSDVTIADGTFFAPSAAFKKTWRLKNIGTCTWTTSYALVFDSGDKMGGPTSVNLPKSVAPGETVDLTLDLTAPGTAGHYIGYWKFKNAAGVLFGIGSTFNKSFWVEINVSTSSTTGVAYDFAANACSAAWYSIQGNLPCPGTDGDAKGFILKVDKPTLENGAQDPGKGLLTMPQNAYNGDIHGAFPAFRVQNGDKFQTTVNCAFNATACYVTFRLDYQIGNGPINTLWTFREKYEGLYYRASVDLSSLAGQDVKFILTVLATGSATGDRALWVNPIIARAGASVTPVPVTPVPTTVTPQPATCDRAQFVSDVTVPDGTTFNPNAPFTKTWRLKNVGTCTWTTSYSLIFDTGDKMGGADSTPLPKSVAPGQTVDLSVNLTAPGLGGSYRGYWKFKNNNNVAFGIGSGGTKSWWVDIKVSGPTAVPTTPTTSMTPGTPGPTATPIAGMQYDFAANACSGAWFSSAGALPCPGTDGDQKGFVLKVSNPKLENGTVDSRPGLLTFPQNIFNGYIQGIYPPYRVKAGDRFRSIINCELGATSCYVVFRLDYYTGSGPINTFWAFVEKNEGQYYQADLDLAPLVGKDINFVLSVLATGSPSGDRALWVAPMIFNPGSASSTPPSPTSTAITSTPSPTATGTSTSNWNTYQNVKYGFSFKFPPASSVSSQSDNSGRVNLPFTAGTPLREKYIDVSVVEGANPCKSPAAGLVTSSETVTINGIQFLKEIGNDGAAGNLYDWVGYSTTKGNACISLTFVMHSANPGVFVTPLPPIDVPAETSVFPVIMSTYQSQ